MKQFNWTSLVEWALRINVFVKLFSYGTGKILGGQFYRKGNLPEEVANTTLSDVRSFDLAWTFFGHSQGYILFIGISQLVGALLFLLPRTKVWGALVLIPILLNIIVVDYLFGVAYGAMFSACFYLGSILFVLYRNREALVEALRKLWIAPTEKWGGIYAILLIGLFFGLVFGVEFFLIDFFGYDDR
ncbi:MAG: hypothetical protein KTR22_07635 [Flavobacteriaceae bacterium]|nr:hypothetical protein [Flavobacteriaceae bacterium]